MSSPNELPDQSYRLSKPKLVAPTATSSKNMKGISRSSIDRHSSGRSDFNRRLLSNWIAVLLLTSGILMAAEIPITYTLPKDGRVSLAVYNTQGQMVRTLRNAEPQKAGARTVTWDGLDRNGQPVPIGDYTWKLLLSQGMKAEYMLSLGTSVGIDHWTAQHGGPYSVTALPGGEVLVGGSTEGSPMIVRLNPKTSRTTWVNDVWAGGGVNDIAVLDQVVYTFHGGGKVRKFDLTKGSQIPGDFQLELPGPELGPTESSKETKRLPFAANRGPFRIRGKIIFPSGSGELNVTVGGKSDTVKSPKDGNVANFSLPGKEGHLSQLGQYDASQVKEIVLEPGAMMDDWSAESVQIIGVPASLSGRDGVLTATYPALNQVAWHDPEGKVLATAEVKNPRALAVRDAQTLLVLSGNDVLEVKRDGTQKTVITGLIAPEKIAVDPTSGQIFVTDLGKSQQVKRFSREGKLEATFGREGGRNSGKYVPQNFILTKGGISADGNGGFWITEPYAAPRRTAHFDANGKLVGEWYGGQQYYTWAAPDPEDANLFWMDSQWGWIMQVRVDWDKRTWEVLATYPWGGDYLEGLIGGRFKMAQRHYVRKLDLDKDGKKETYLFGNNGALMRVDEASGKLRAVSVLGEVAGRVGWFESDISRFPKVWWEALRQVEKDPEKNFRYYRAFAWADDNGDNEFQSEEFRMPRGNPNGGLGGLLALDKDLGVIRTTDSQAIRYPLTGFTASAAPVWDSSKSESLPGPDRGTVQAVLWNEAGDLFEIVRGGGDGYGALSTWGMGHGFTWPANLVDRSGVAKWNAQGEMQWLVGGQATQTKNAPGQLHHPVHFAGLVNGTIGVCDKIVQPVVFWTEDGLYAGGLFDGRAEHQLPARLYAWGKGETDDFHPETGLAALQYDWMLGGSLIQRPNGEVIFIGSGFNNCPAYRVTGWKEFQRQEGKVTVKSPVAGADEKGSGLSAEFFTNTELKGDPSFSLISPKIWFEPARAAQKEMPQFNWPVSTAPSVPTDPFSASKLPEESLIDLEEKATQPIASKDGGQSARWRGEVKPKFTERYQFSVYQDQSKGGRAKLWLGGRLILESNVGSNKVTSEPIELQGGEKYAIQLEWSGKRDGELHLVWQSSSQSVEHIPTQSLYPKSDKAVGVIQMKSTTERADRPLKEVKSASAPEWILTRSNLLEAPLTVELEWSGSARPGVDYTAMPEKVTFQPGQSELRLPVQLLPSQEIAVTTGLRGNVKISPDYVFDGSRDGGSLLIADSRIQRISVSDPTVVELDPLTNPAGCHNLNTAQLGRLVDGSGLRTTTTTPAKHDTEVKNAWVGEFLNFEKVHLEFDLGKLHHLAELLIWNFNTRNAHGNAWGTGSTVRAAPERIRISIATDSGGPWTDLPVTTLRQTDGVNPTPGQIIPVNQLARFVRISFPKNSREKLGLAEVEFHGLPIQSN